jgi:ribosomal protein L40E
MKPFQIGTPKRECLPKSPRFFFVSHGPDLHYNGESLDCFSPADTMPSTQPNLTRPHLTLDEKSFQGLLSAAFTIQEHNDQMNRARPTPARPEARREPEATSVCPHCGARKLAEESSCQKCSLDQSRPGERLQRNWASMWLMSQEQGLWPERSTEVGGGAQKAREGTQKAVPPPAPSVCDSASNGLFILPVAKETAREATTEVKTGTIGDRALDESVLDKLAIDQPETESEWTTETSADLTREDLAREDVTREDLAPEDSDLAVEPLQLSDSEDSFPTEANDDGDGANSEQRFADLRGKLHSHRANVYLGAAVFVAVLVLLWPAANSPRRAALGPFERALVTLGLAEAPAPAVHLPGDPGIEVWVDSHTALYYCPGEEQYGKTADGRFTSQRDAQMDRFEPAGRSVCE